MRASARKHVLLFQPGNCHFESPLAAAPEPFAARSGMRIGVAKAISVAGNILKAPGAMSSCEPIETCQKLDLRVDKHFVDVNRQFSQAQGAPLRCNRSRFVPWHVRSFCRPNGQKRPSKWKQLRGVQKYLWMKR
jgi:hypothetical protein